MSPGLKYFVLKSLQVGVCTSPNDRISAWIKRFKPLVLVHKPYNTTFSHTSTRICLSSVYCFLCAPPSWQNPPVPPASPNPAPLGPYPWGRSCRRWGLSEAAGGKRGRRSWAARGCSSRRWPGGPGSWLPWLAVLCQLTPSPAGILQLAGALSAPDTAPTPVCLPKLFLLWTFL